MVGRRRMNSGKIDEEVSWRNGKSLRQLDDILQRDITFATLHAADVVAVQSRSFGQFLLRVASLVAELPQRIAKSGFDGACCHTPILGL